jgi:hypothetical protein
MQVRNLAEALALDDELQAQVMLLSAKLDAADRSAAESDIVALTESLQSLVFAQAVIERLRWRSIAANDRLTEEPLVA